MNIRLGHTKEEDDEGEMCAQGMLATKNFHQTATGQAESDVCD